jgi:hypothetical protein
MIKPKAARKPRKKSSRSKGWFKRPDLAAAMKARWADPEYREKMRLRDINREAMRASDPVKFSRTGVPNGMRRRTAKRLWAKAEQAADRFIKMLEDEGDLPQITVPDSDDGMAKEALKEAFKLAIVPGDLKIKMAAIRTVLDFTKSKPESKSKVTVQTAEDWLKAAQGRHENGGDD